MTRPIERWRWTESEGPPRLRGELAREGLSWFSLGEVSDEANRAPWSLCQRLWGEAPIMLERQPIRPISGGRSFASSSVYTPPHTDSQLFQGAPPHLQWMLCLRPAAVGGESLFIDSWRLLERLEREDPPFFSLLFSRARRIPFWFGDVFGPTLSLRGEGLVFTHAPFGSDELSARICGALSREEPHRLRAEAGDMLVINNHRMLHGREAFDDPAREFVRLLSWLSAPLPAPERYLSLAREAARSLSKRLSGAPLEVKRQVGLGAPAAPDGGQRLRVVLEMLRGVPPGVLATRHQVQEAELYRWRDEALTAAAEALQRLGAKETLSAQLVKLVL